MGRQKLAPRVLEKSKGKYSYWIIKDGGKEISTGAATEAEALKELGKYLVKRTPDAPKLDDPLSADLATILGAYLRGHAHKTAAPKLLALHVETHLLPFWGKLYLSDVNSKNCAAYIKRRTAMKWQGRNVKDTTASKELGTLNAAMVFYAKDHGMPAGAVQRVTKETTPGRRERVLERWELCDLIKAARRLGFPHLVRLLMIGRYTGTRLDAMLRTRWIENPFSGHVSLGKGIYYRRGDAEKETKKRRPPCTIPPKLLWFLKRWAAADAAKGFTHVIHVKGEPLDDVRANYSGTMARTPWSRIIEAASLYRDEIVEGEVKRSSDVTPHVLRHTCVTWNLLDDVSYHKVAGLVGASPTVLEKNYAHHTLGIRPVKLVRRPGWQDRLNGIEKTA